jgi:hypothetical protein
MRSALLAWVITLVSAVVLSCAGGNYLKTETLKDGKGLTGTFTVILYGANHIDDIATVAILDIEGDGYEIELFAPDFTFVVNEGQSAGEAMDSARHHVSFHPVFLRAHLRKILSHDGSVIGYELRPVYYPLAHGVSDVMKVHYFMMEGGKVRAHIRLKDSVDIRGDGEGDAYIWGD